MNANNSGVATAFLTTLDGRNMV